MRRFGKNGGEEEKVRPKGVIVIVHHYIDMIIENLFALKN